MASKKKAAVTTEPVETKYGVVLYTDGGARPNPGCAGYGIHGYTYDINYKTDTVPTREGAPTDRGYISSAEQSDKPGVQVSPLTYVDGWGTVGVQATNNMAEILAGSQGLVYAQTVMLTTPVDCVNVYTDSEMVVNTMTKWYKNWVRDNFMKPDGSERPNATLWKDLIAQQEKLTSSGVSVNWNWVRGHSTSVGNQLADQNATRGVIQTQKHGSDMPDTLLIRDAKGYWSPKNPYNRMFSLNRCYFILNSPDVITSKDGRSVYHCGQSQDDNEYDGKRMSDQAYGVLFLKEPEPVLEALRKYQTEVCDTTFTDVIKVYLANVFTAKTYQELTDHGCQYVTKADQFNDLYSIDEKQLTWHARPPRKIYNTLTSLQVLTDLLESYLVRESEPEAYTVYTDITAYFYEHEEKKGKVTCKLSATITQTLKTLTIKGNYDLGGGVREANVKLTLGLDSPNRNALSALAERDPTVTLLTRRESAHGFRYYVIIRAGEDVGIYSSMVSNLQLERS